MTKALRVSSVSLPRPHILRGTKTGNTGSVLKYFVSGGNGELWIEKASAISALNIPYRFTGKERDKETSLYYVGARYLDSRTSRWLSVDPALGEYVPVAPNSDSARRRNQNLPGMGGVFNTVNLHAYHYSNNNPIRYTDPDGRTATYSVDNENKTININVDIIIYGKDATNQIAQEYKKGIEDAWGGNHTANINGERYSVNFNVNVTVGKSPGLLKRLWNSFFGTKNFIKADASNTRSYVQSGFMGEWRIQGRGGKTLAADNPAAHEFGHLIGFKDRYTDTGGTMPGWAGNIMGEPAMFGVVEQRNIDAITGYITQPNMRKNGVIRPKAMFY